MWISHFFNLSFIDACDGFFNILYLQYSCLLSPLYGAMIQTFNASVYFYKLEKKKKIVLVMSANLSLKN